MRDAVASLGPEAFEAALQGFTFFGFGDVCDLLEHARSQLRSGRVEREPEVSVELDYAGLIPDESILRNAVETHWRAQPSAFAPVIEA